MTLHSTRLEKDKKLEYMRKTTISGLEVGILHSPTSSWTTLPLVQSYITTPI